MKGLSFWNRTHTILTKTREMRIFLLDIKEIGGLATYREMHDEHIPPQHLLEEDNLPRDLVNVHNSMLCSSMNTHHKKNYISFRSWADKFIDVPITHKQRMNRRDFVDPTYPFDRYFMNENGEEIVNDYNIYMKIWEGLCIHKNSSWQQPFLYGFVLSSFRTPRGIKFDQRHFPWLTRWPWGLE